MLFPRLKSQVSDPSPDKTRLLSVVTSMSTKSPMRSLTCGLTNPLRLNLGLRGRSSHRGAVEESIECHDSAFRDQDYVLTGDRWALTGSSKRPSLPASCRYLICRAQQSEVKLGITSQQGPGCKLYFNMTDVGSIICHQHSMLSPKILHSGQAFALIPLVGNRYQVTFDNIGYPSHGPGSAH